MAQTPAQRRASDQVGAWLAHHQKNNAWLVEATGADPGTIGDFLNGNRWPKVGTQGKIEKALGWPPGSIRQIGNGADPLEVGAGFNGDELPHSAPASDFERIEAMGISEAQKAVLRATLSALLWPDGPPADVRRELRRLTGA